MGLEKSIIWKASLSFINAFFFFCKIIFTLHISVPFAEIFHWLFNPNKTGLQASTVRPVQHLNKYYWAQKAKQLDVRDTSTWLRVWFHIVWWTGCHSNIPSHCTFQTAVSQEQMGPQGSGLFIRKEHAHSKFRLDRYPCLN